VLSISLLRSESVLLDHSLRDPLLRGHEPHTEEIEEILLLPQGQELAIGPLGLAAHHSPTTAQLLPIGKNPRGEAHEGVPLGIHTGSGAHEEEAAPVELMGIEEIEVAAELREVEPHVLRIRLQVPGHHPGNARLDRLAHLTEEPHEPLAISREPHDLDITHHRLAPPNGAGHLAAGHGRGDVCSDPVRQLARLAQLNLCSSHVIPQR